MDSEPVIDWLLEGDPAIRWQVYRDLLGRKDWEVERARVSQGEDWAGRLLAKQDPEGTWGGGIYTPKWVSTTYTLLTLIGCGLHGDHPAARRGAELIMDKGRETPLEPEGDLSGRPDLCILGFWLQIGAKFMRDEPWLPSVVRRLLAAQMADGGWNCRLGRAKGTHHSSFHTTFNVLEGLQAAAEAGILERGTLREVESRTFELMLQHRMYRSDKTGEVIHPKFTMLSHPYRWHYDILRGMDAMRNSPEIGDSRLDDAIELLESKRKPNGRWPVQNKYSGVVFFDMEKAGGDSRWNTLRALRVLRSCSTA